MKYLCFIAIFFIFSYQTNALVINEIMSNPTGDDSGHEWIELYNDADEDVDLASLSLSIKGGNPIVVSSVSGGTVVRSKEYAIIGSTVSGATKFMLDYPSYAGVLLKSSISLVNSGVTSIDIRLLGNIVDSISSYTAAKEGYTYSKTSSGYSVFSPTPGKENDQSEVSTSASISSTTPTTGSQMTLPQSAPPSSDIILYLEPEKIVVAGAPTFFKVSATTRLGKVIDGITYTWSYGDGGQSFGSSTIYRYFYPGRYIAQVEGTNGLIYGNGRMVVRVVSPDITISELKDSRYGKFLEVTNPNPYELDISTWKISIDGVLYSIPMHTVLPPGKTTLSGASLGFASTTLLSGGVIRLLFSNLDEVTRATQNSSEPKAVDKNSLQSTNFVSKEKKNVQTTYKPQPVVALKSSTTSLELFATSTPSKKDKRLGLWIKSLLK